VTAEHWRQPDCPGCRDPFHTAADCDPIRSDQAGNVCACWSCLPSDFEDIPQPREGR
jgi:hypothetical protein